MCSAVFACRCPLCGEEASFSGDDGITENGELYVSFFCLNNEIHTESLFFILFMNAFKIGMCGA